MTNKKHEYVARYAIDGRFTAEVNGDGIDEVLEAAEEVFGDADFGEAEDIEGKVVVIEDSDGNFVYEKSNGSVYDAKIGSGKFFVRFRVTARWFPVIKANDVLRARHLGDHYFATADFGEMEDIDCDLINIEEDDVVVYEA